MRKSRIFLPILALALCMPGVRAADSDPETLMRRARDLFGYGRWSDARHELLRAKEALDPSELLLAQEVEYYLAACAVELGSPDAEGALRAFEERYPYYEYMYREANAWQQSFFAPHDTEGLIALYPSPEAFGEQLDRLFSIPWEGYEVDNLSCFIGQYCHGNQPDHGFTYLYYFIGRQERSQELIDYILDRFYGMGPEELALCGMDDAGEMSSWYVLNAIGLYTYSPADPEYIVTVPLFDRTDVTLGDGRRWTIRREGEGRRIESITCGGRPVEGWFVGHDALGDGELVIRTAPGAE